MVSKPHYDYGLLWRAIAISLLAHVLLLLQPGFGKDASQASGAQSLIALLRPQANAVSTTAPSAISEQQMRRLPAQMNEVPAAATPMAATATTVPQVAPAAASAQPGAMTGAGKSSSSTLAVAGNADFDFAEGRKSYLFAIAAEARRVKKYPPRAFAAGWTGTAEIRIAVAAGGNVQPPQLLSSSGHTDIDNAALSFVGLALKRTPVPENLRAHAFEFVLPVSFNINDE